MSADLERLDFRAILASMLAAAGHAVPEPDPEELVGVVTDDGD
jgi:hypothetical protein